MAGDMGALGVVVASVSLAATVIGISGVIVGIGRLMGRFEAAQAAAKDKERELTEAAKELRAAAAAQDRATAKMEAAIARLPDLEEGVQLLREAFAGLAAGNKAQHDEVNRRLAKVEQQVESLSAQIKHVASGGAGNLIEFDGKRG